MVVSQRPASYRRATLIAVGSASFLVVVGSVLAIGWDSFNIPGLTHNIGESFARLGGADLSVKIDRTTLPADGNAQTKITVVSSKNHGTVNAVIDSGGGKLDRHPENPDKEFVYTAGTEPGTVNISFTAGSLTDNVTLELVASSPPKAAAIVAPPDGSTTNDPRPEVSGTGPALSRIVITTNGAENTTTRTNEQGVFAVVLEKPLYNGQHTISATVVNELGAASQTSNLVTINVKTDPVKVDTDNIRTSPTQLVADSSFGLFIPASRNTGRVVVELEGANYTLVDAHGSSVFSGILPTPPQAGVYFANLVLYDTGGNETRFDKLLRLTVASP